MKHRVPALFQLCIGMVLLGAALGPAGTVAGDVGTAIPDVVTERWGAHATAEHPGDPADVTLNQTNPTWMGEEAAEVVVGSHNGSLKWAAFFFDVSNLPPTTVVRSARLRLKLHSYSTPQDTWLQIHQLLDPDGLGQWTASEATFNRRRSRVAWSLSGNGNLTTVVGAEVGRAYLGNLPQWKTTAVEWDVTSAVRGWVADPAANHGLALPALAAGLYSIAASEHSDAGLRPFLEITYEGANSNRPAQVTGAVAVHRSGQTFITWNEIALTNPETRYRVYRHTAPISAATLDDATLLAEVEPNSGYYRHEGEGCSAGSNCSPIGQSRFIIEDDGAPLPEGVGLFVYTPHDPAPIGAYYAVTSVVEGNENRDDFAGNLAGPVTEVEATPRPVRVWTNENNTGWVYTQFMDYRRWNPAIEGYACNFYVGVPAGYDPAGAPLPLLMQLHAYTGRYRLPASPGSGGSDYGWPTIQVFPDDRTNTWWFGFGQNAGHLDRRLADAPIVNYTHQRLDAIFDFVLREFNVDPDRVYLWGGSMGGSGAVNYGLRRGERFAAVYAESAMTDFATAGAAGGAAWETGAITRLWGRVAQNLPTSLLKANGEPYSIWEWYNLQTWVEAHPATELPFLADHHGQEDGTIDWETQGLPWYPALEAGRQGFVGVFDNADHNWPGFVAQSTVFTLTDFNFRRDESFPGLSNASNSGDPARSTGCRNCGLEWSSSWLNFAGPPEDTASRYALVLRTNNGAAATVDVTPRRLQRFSVVPGNVYPWENRRASDGSLVASGTIVAGSDALLTIPAFAVSPEGNRLILEPAGSSPVTPTAAGSGTPTATGTPTPTATRPPSVPPTESGPPPCPADVDGDGHVTITDLLAVVVWWGRLGFPSAVDVNSDGTVNLVDLMVVSSRWAQPCGDEAPLATPTATPTASQTATRTVEPTTTAVPTIAAEGGLAVPLTITERAGVARTDEPVQSGIPLPRAAQITSPDGLAILDAATGRVVDADFVVTARWGGPITDTTRPIKWLLATFKTSVPANGTANFVLTNYRPPAPTQAITLDSSSPDVWIVDTGAARFEISTLGFNLFHRVTLAGKDLVTPSPANGPYYTLDGATYGATAAGGGRVSLVRFGNRDQTLTLKMKGAHRTVGDSTDADLDFNTFLTFYAGSSAVRVQHTVQNNRPWVALENNADFRPIGSPNSVSADEIGLRLRLNLGSNPSWRLSTTANGEPIVGTLDETVSIYQDSAGGERWAMWRNARGTGSGPVADPIYGPAAYVSFRGFEAKQSSTRIATGERMTGYLDVSGSNGGVTVAVRDFWQNFPKALRATASGEVQVALFPDEFRARHTLRVGEQKTHDLLFYFHTLVATDVASIGGGFTKPLLALAPPAWYAEITRVIPTVSTTGPDSYRFATIPKNLNGCYQQDITPQEYDAFMARHLSGPGAATTCNPNAYDYAFNGLDEAIPAAQMYSWMDYGDIPIDFEAPDDCSGDMRAVTGQYGWKYDGDYGLWLNFLRSGDYRFLDYALAATEHTADIDMLHHGRQSRRGFSSFLDGGMFGHSQHNNSGARNPHRNGDPNHPCYGGSAWNGTPTFDMLFGAGALSLGAWVTGEPHLAEALSDIAEWTVFYGRTYHNSRLDNGRAAANAVNTLAWAYTFTGDRTYRDEALRLVGISPVFHNPLVAYADSSHAGLWGDTLGRLVSVLREADETDLDQTLANLASGAVPENALQYNGWDFPRADAYAWAALLLPQRKAVSLANAASHFQTGVRNPAWRNDGFGIQRVWQIKEWVMHLRMGHVYQLATYDLLGGPKFTPGRPPIAPTGGHGLQNTPPTARISGDLEIGGSTGTPLVFDGSTSNDPETDGEALRYLWDFGDGMTATGRTVTHTYQEAGTWTVRLWVSDGEAPSLATQTVEVTFVNHAPVAAAGPDRSAPIDVGITFDGSGSTDSDEQPLSYTWDFGDGAGATGATAAHAYATAGVYTVALTVSDGELTGTDTARVTVNPVAGTSTIISFRDGESGYTGTRDTRLWSKAPGSNYGSSTELIVGRQNYPELNTLLRFDLSAIPEGARIESATLDLTVARTSWEGSAPTLTLHLATTGWVEGTGCCTSDGATWTTRDGMRAWEKDGGGDFDVASAITLTAQPVGTIIVANITPIVQDWMLGTPNQGVLLTGSTTKNWWSVGFHSRQSATPTARPRSTITYTPLAGTNDAP